MGHNCTNLITVPGYHEPIRHDRKINGRHGGGLLIYIAENLVFINRKEYQSEFYEHIWVDVKINSTVYAINAFYRPPNESQADHQHFLQFSENILTKLSNYNSAQYKNYCLRLKFWKLLL